MDVFKFTRCQWYLLTKMDISVAWHISQYQHWIRHDNTSYAISFRSHYFHTHYTHSFQFIFSYLFEVVLRNMPQQCHQASLTPYTQVMSSLCKPDLVRLCSEFKLARDGSVVQLRNHLKHYLNLHRGHLFHNPRYTVLFPRLWGPNQPPPPPSVPTSQAISYRSPSPAFSDETWHGVQDQDGDDISNTPQDQHLYSPAHNSHHDNQDHFDQPLPEFFQELAHNFLPVPSPFLINPDMGHPLPATHVGEVRK